MLLLLKILSSIVLTGIGVGFVLACLAAAWFFCTSVCENGSRCLD